MNRDAVNDAFSVNRSKGHIRLRKIVSKGWGAVWKARALWVKTEEVPWLAVHSHKIETLNT